jgi:arylsulfatase
VSTWKDEKETDWELYDMEKDRTEMNNLAATMPEIVIKMSRITVRGPKKITY